MTIFPFRRICWGVNGYIPLARLDLYAEAIILTKFGHQSTTSYPVSIHDLSAAFGSLPSSSGFLPQNTLFHGRKKGQQFIGIYIPAQKQAITVDQTTMQIPLPPAIFIGCGKQYEIHATVEYPKNKRAQLYHYPSPNVWDDGRICRGDTPFPTCRPDTIHTAFKMFVESRFNNHLVTGKSRSYPQNVIELWKTLDGKEEFPLSELVPNYRTLGNWV